MAQVPTETEATRLANNWVSFVIANRGSWGDAVVAECGPMQDIMRDGRRIGFLFDVKPDGFIVVPVRKELGTIKAYATSGTLDMTLRDGMPELIGLMMEHAIKWTESQVGAIDQAAVSAVEAVLEVSMRSAWQTLTLPPEEFRSKIPPMDYQESGILLDSEWHQGEPYYRESPTPLEAGNPGCTDPHCAVGCGPLALAQVMRYWSWPPYSEYYAGAEFEWTLMPDVLTPTSPTESIMAVARLCRAAGTAAGADYCVGGQFDDCETTTYMSEPVVADCLDALEDHLMFSTAGENRNRGAYTASEWFDLIRGDINSNRPLPYGIEAHVIVCDGWTEVLFEPGIRHYHMNYGGGPGAWNAWYELDNLPLGGISHENLLENIYPSASQGNTLVGSHMGLPGQFNYVYFNRDAQPLYDSPTYTGMNAQFLAGVTVRGRPRTPYEVSFVGGILPTKMYTGGDKMKGIHLTGFGASLVISGTGGVRLH